MFESWFAPARADGLEGEQTWFVQVRFFFPRIHGLLFSCGQCFAVQLQFQSGVGQVFDLAQSPLDHGDRFGQRGFQVKGVHVILVFEPVGVYVDQPGAFDQ